MDPLFWRAEARFDWARFVQEHGGVRALRSRADEYVLECPDCGKPKLAVNVQKRVWRCFVCNEAGREICSLISKIERVNWGQSLLRVLDGHKIPIGSLDYLDGFEIHSEKSNRRIFRERPWPEGFQFLSEPNFFSQASGAQAMAYCSERNIPAYVIQEMGLGFCSSGAMANRLIFPCFDLGNRLIFYQGRATWKPLARELRHIKTLSPRSEEGFAGPADCLLNLHYCAERIEIFHQRLIIVEGPIDCAHAWPDAVATWGKKISAGQMELLLRAGVKAIDLCWDADAQQEMLQTAPLLSDLFEVRLIFLPPGVDPGSISKDQLERFRGQAQIVGSGQKYHFLP